MAYGSYYQSTPNYFQNPAPYTSSDIGAPVPGWGVNPRVAGPSRLGVGAFGQGRIIAPGMGPAIQQALARKYGRQAPAQDTTVYVEPTVGGSGIPWWVWPIAAAVVVGGVSYYGTKKGWF